MKKKTKEQLIKKINEIAKSLKGYKTFEDQAADMKMSRQNWYLIRTGKIADVPIELLYSMSKHLNFNFFIWLAGDSEVKKEVKKHPEKFGFIDPVMAKQIMSENDGLKKKIREKDKLLDQYKTLISAKQGKK